MAGVSRALRTVVLKILQRRDIEQSVGTLTTTIKIRSHVAGTHTLTTTKMIREGGEGGRSFSVVLFMGIQR